MIDALRSILPSSPFTHASIASAVAESGGFSIAGGGETVTAIDHFSVRDKISYISTGGGAFLEYVQGIKLPAVQILEEKVIGK